VPKKSYGEHDRQSIGYLISRVVAWKGRLESLQNAMKDSGVDQLTVEGQAELKRGIAGIEAFGENAHRALHNARVARGDLGTDKNGSGGGAG